MSEFLDRFRAEIVSASEEQIRSDPTLGGRLTLAHSGDITINYAPFEHVEERAKVVLVGITPGAQQAQNALISARRSLLQARAVDEVLRAAKVFASFSGPMRTNLASMLDHIGLANWLGLSSTSLLWGDNSRSVHFTSALRFPIFIRGENYAGQPSMVSTPILRQCIEKYLRKEAETLSNAVWIPLGPKASEGVRLLVKQGVLNEAMVLDGLPHPSGANAERIAFFLGRKLREELSPKTNPSLLEKARKLLGEKVSALAPLAG